MSKNKTKKGITLISLVITIILLLILGAVAINLAVDSDGLFRKAGQAANTWNTSVADEQTKLQNLLDIADSLGSKSPVSTYVTDEVTGRKAPIPTGFVASKISTEDEISEGLVIYKLREGAQIDWDNNEVTIGDETTNLQESLNQYVWIPVENINDMVMCSECGGSKENLVYNDATQTLKCTNTHTGTPMLVGKLYTEYIEGTQKIDFTQDNQTFDPDSGLREPAIVTGSDGTQLDALENKFQVSRKSSYSRRIFK